MNENQANQAVQNVGTKTTDPNEQKKLFGKFATMSWTYWFAACFGSYLTIFLQSIGWQPHQVGTLNSLNSAVGVVSTPFWGTLSDKIRSIKKIVIILIITGALTYALIPYMDYKIAGISLLFIIIPVSGFFRTPLMSLIDNWTVRASNKHGLTFGAIRSFGSFSFGVIGLILGYLVPRMNGENGNKGTVMTFFGYGFFSIALLLVVLWIKEDVQSEGAKKQKLSEMQFGKLFSNYYYMTYLVYAMLIQIPLACVYSFQPYLMKDIGVNTGTIGYITGFKAFIEIPMLILMDKVRNKVPLYVLLFGSGALYMLESFFYSISGSFTHLLLIGILQGLGGGLHIAAGSNYVATLAPDNLKATAQTLNGSMVSLAGIAGNLIGGHIIEAVGIRVFYRGCGFIILFGLLMFIFSFPFGEKVLKLKRPQIVKHGTGR